MRDRKEIIRIRISHRFYAFLKRPTREYVSKNVFNILQARKKKKNETISKPFKPSQGSAQNVPLPNQKKRERALHLYHHSQPLIKILIKIQLSIPVFRIL